MEQHSSIWLPNITPTFKVGMFVYLFVCLFGFTLDISVSQRKDTIPLQSVVSSGVFFFVCGVLLHLGFPNIVLSPSLKLISL